VYHTSAPSKATVANWAREFKHGRESLEDDPRSGAPSTAVNNESIESVERLVMEDRRISVAKIADLTGISSTSVHRILHESLHMNKVCTKWIPRILTPDMRHNRVTCAKELLQLGSEDPAGFYHRIVTGDESWIHHYDPESQAEAKQWKHPDSPTPKRPRQSRSAGKIMMSVFWDDSGVLLLDFLPHKETVTGIYYSQLITRLHAAIKEKRRGKLTHGVVLLHDNAPVHKAKVSQHAIHDCQFEELNHPPYSPDMAPSDYYLFSHLKKYLRGKHFESDDELMHAVTAWFDAKDITFFKAGIESLRDHWLRVVNNHGQYIE
jgi:histone-lysine N-methyltransferase SETMAR